MTKEEVLQRPERSHRKGDRDADAAGRWRFFERVRERARRNTIQIMAPAASPSPSGSNGSKKLTSTNAGTAISGCGRLVKMLQSEAFDDRRCR